VPSLGPVCNKDFDPAISLFCNDHTHNAYLMANQWLMMYNASHPAQVPPAPMGALQAPYSKPTLVRSFLANPPLNRWGNPVPHKKDRVRCEVCGEEYGRNNGTMHRRTQRHIRAVTTPRAPPVLPAKTLTHTAPKSEAVVVTKTGRTVTFTIDFD
jgi:hypothetical protein